MKTHLKFANANVMLFGAVVLSLGACKPSSQSGGNVVAPTQTATGTVVPDGSGVTSTDREDLAKKLDGYVEAHNSFVGTFGFQEKAEAYRNSHIADASTSGRFTVDAGWINQGLTKLKAANGLSAPSSDLDNAAGALVISMGKVQDHLASLQTYYSSKKYLDDKLARGKAEDAQMLAEIDTAENDLAKFNALLDVALDKRDEALLDELKSSDPLRYHTKLALFHAKKLVNIFGKPGDINKPELIAKADTEIAQIEQAIADGHQDASKIGKRDPSSFSSLTSMLGSYRSLKQGHDASDMESMVQDYNRAVDASNTFGSME